MELVKKQLNDKVNNLQDICQGEKETRIEVTNRYEKE